MRSRIEIAAVLLVSLAALGASDEPPPASTGAMPARIEFLESLEAATAIGADAPKPIVIQFGATWCGWCRKLEDGTLRAPEVRSVSPRFTWVKIDIDESPALARQYNVRGVPHAVVVDAKGTRLSELRGYGDADAYVAFLLRGEKMFAAPALDPAPTAPQDVAARTRELVELLAPAEAQGRGQIVAAIGALGPTALAELVALLESDRLATRAAAAYALREVTETGLEYDPFAPSQARAAQVARWREWLESRESSSAAPAAGAAAALGAG